MPFYLVYTSHPRTQMSKDTLEEIAALSRKKNSQKNITGMLLGIENRYLQYLEGKEEEVITLFGRIKQDPRHYEVNKWIQGNTDKRIFSQWSMASWMLSKKELESIKGLGEIREYLDSPKHINYPPGRFLEMIKNLMESWITHGSERIHRSNE